MEFMRIQSSIMPAARIVLNQLTTITLKSFSNFKVIIPLWTHTTHEACSCIRELRTTPHRLTSIKARYLVLAWKSNHSFRPIVTLSYTRPSTASRPNYTRILIHAHNSYLLYIDNSNLNQLHRNSPTLKISLTRKSSQWAITTRVSSSEEPQLRALLHDEVSPPLHTIS